MNERIRELELEAIAYADSKVPADNRYNDIYYSIVRRVLVESVLQDVLNIVSNGGEFASRPKLVEQIQEQFGVE